MKITGYKTTAVEIPLARRIKTSIHDMRSVGCILLELETDQGVCGEAYVFSLNALRLAALQEVVAGFSHLVEERNPHFIHAILESM